MIDIVDAIPKHMEKRINFKISLPSCEMPVCERNIFCSKEQAILINSEMRKSICQFEKIIENDSKISFVRKLAKKWKIAEDELYTLFNLISSSPRIDTTT